MYNEDKSKFNVTLLEKEGLTYKTYPGEEELHKIIDLMKEELSEPYPIFTYRYFVNLFPDCNILVYDKDKFVGCIIGKCEKNKNNKMKGYIAMIAVDKAYRGKKIGRILTCLFIDKMKEMKANEITLETEVTNGAALALYESVGFVRSRTMLNYYLNANDAYKLKLWLNNFEEENVENK